MIRLFNAECLEKLKQLESNSIDSLLTDPPAAISFMNKGWDSDRGGRTQWISWMGDIMRECHRVLKPGAHGLVWALPRTSHWTATALEDAGFEIRDSVVHIFGSGFPKSLNVSKAIDKAAGIERAYFEDPRWKEKYPNENNKNLGRSDKIGQAIRSDKPLMTSKAATDEAKQWEGWGSALKPAHENWILVRKPLSERTLAANILKHGCGGLNIDESRIATSKEDLSGMLRTKGTDIKGQAFVSVGRNENFNPEYIPPPPSPLGRFPANLVLSHHESCELECHPECAVQELDAHSGDRGAIAPVRKKLTPITTNTANIKPHSLVGDDGASFRGDNGGASRFFYCSKPSKSDKGADNIHPTVKSTKLMEYLIKLITPLNGKCLDPFMGSGSTGVAAVRCNRGFIGIEQDEAYFLIAQKRLNI